MATNQPGTSAAVSATPPKATGWSNKDQARAALKASVKELVKEELDPVMGLLKTLEKPASASGLSPQDFIAKHTQGGTQPLVFAPDGQIYRPNWSPYGKSIGPQRDPRDGKTKTFGDYLGALARWEMQRDQKDFNALASFGTERFTDTSAGVVKTALAESAGATGGYTIPPAFLPQLMTYALEGSIFASRATKHPLTTRTLQIPSLDIVTDNHSQSGAGQTNLLGGVVASWASEAQTRAETEPTFRQTTLTAWELSFYTLASNTLLADNAVGLDSLLTQLFTKAIAWHTDFAYIQGNGVGKPLGVLNAAAAVSVTRNGGANSSTFRYPDIGNMIGSLYWPLFNDPVAFMMHPSVIQQVWQMTDNSAGSGNGRLVFQPINMGAQEGVKAEEGGMQAFGTLAGKPLFVTEKLPALGTNGDVMLVHFPSYVLGTRMELEISVSPHVKFLNNQMAWRVVWRGDGQPWLQGSVKLSDGTAVSPFVYLH